MQNKSGGLLSAIGDLFFAFQSKLQFFEREYLKKKGIDEVTPAEIKVLYIDRNVEHEIDVGNRGRIKDNPGNALDHGR